MAEKKKYNSILVSGRKDETLTYSKFIKDEESGESVKESLDKKVNVTDELETQQIKDGAITNEKMAAGSVGNTNLQDGSVSNEKLEDGSITNEKLAENSITKDKLKDNTIGIEKLDPELRQTINAATGLPENLVETIQNIDDTLKGHQSQLDDKQSQIDDKQQQITANDEDISLLQTRSTQMEETIKSIAATGGASQATAVTYNNEKSRLTAVNIQSAVDEVVDKTTIKDEEGTIVETPFRYIQNEEFIFAKVDAEDKLLFGIQWDGTPVFGKTSAVEDRLQARVNLLADKITTILGDDDTTSAIDTLKELKDFFANIDNTQTLTSILANLNSVSTKLGEDIKNLQDTKADKEEGKSLIEDEVKECFRVIENEEFLKAIVDAEDRVLFGIYRDTGKPYYPQNDMYHISQSEEFLWVILDAANHPLLGIQQDGACWTAKAQWLDDIKALEKTLKDFSTSLYEYFNIDLKGSSISILGDSLSTFEGYLPVGNVAYYPNGSNDVLSVDKTWWMKLISHTNARLEVNNSYSGACVSGNADSSYLNRIGSIGSPKYLIIHGGTNDGWNNIIAGNLHFDRVNSELNTGEFADSYDLLIRKAIYLHPNTNIILVIPHTASDDYANIIETISKHYNLFGCVDLRQYTFYTVNNHYQVEGMDIVEKAVYKELYTNKNALAESGKSLISTDVAESLSVIQNEEYLAVEKDADEKVLSAIYSDGSHYAYNMKSETIPTEFEHIEDPEGRTEITTDAEEKVMSYRDSSGKKHEHDMEVTNLDVSNLNLQGNSVNNIQYALKANGFNVKTPIDWSDYLSNDGDNPLYIPESRYAIINISGIDSMPTAKGVNEKAYFEMWDMQGNYFKKKVIMNAQGNTTMYFPKKSFACDFFDNDWNGDSFAMKIGDWVPQDSFHFKAQYTDFFKGISIVAYKLIQEVWASRSPIYSNPWKKALLSTINITSGSWNNNGVNDLSIQKDTGAKCIPDAFPCAVYLNGTFYGVFNWALKKHRDNYHLNKSLATNIHLDGGAYPMFSPLDWSKFEVRNPKGLITKSNETYDGDSPSELIDSTMEGYDASNKKHILSSKVKASIIAFNSYGRTLNSMTKENGGDEFLNEHFDLDNLIDFFVSQYVLADEDIENNWQWVTYDGIKWFVCDYDKDRTFGQTYNCPGIMDASKMINPNKVSNDNYPFKYLYNYHKDDIKKRYNELKSLGIFTPEHVISLVVNWFNRIPAADLKMEYKKWPESPSNRDDNVDREHWKIKEISYGYDSSYKEYDNSKTYQIGELCIYGKQQKALFECVKETAGNPPITKFYTNIPYDLGYHDSIWRVIKYITERFKYIENELNNI